MVSTISRTQSRRKAAPKLSVTDWAVIKTVWELEPCSAGAVQEYLRKSRNWAYSTVKTIMDRMVEKGFLRPERVKNVTRYSAVISHDEARGMEIRRTIKCAFDNEPAAMVQYVLENEELSAEALERLRQSFIRALSREPNRNG